MRANVVRAMVAAALVGLLLAGCEQEPEGPPIEGPPPEMIDAGDDLASEEAVEMGFNIESSAFRDGETIPAKYTADGEDVSPPLSFEGVPEKAVELALICHDPDAPRAGGWTHWVVYGMAPEIDGLPEGVPTDSTVDDPKLVQGVTDFGSTGYGGPAPPPGAAHRYQFKCYALSAQLDLEPGATKDELEAAMEGKVIGEAMLEGLYARQ